MKFKKKTLNLIKKNKLCLININYVNHIKFEQRLTLTTDGIVTASIFTARRPKIARHQQKHQRNVLTGQNGDHLREGPLEHVADRVLTHHCYFVPTTKRYYSRSGRALRCRKLIDLIVTLQTGVGDDPTESTDVQLGKFSTIHSNGTIHELLPRWES